MPIIFAFFIIFIIPILVLSWLAWEWDFLGQRNFLVAEKFVIEGSVYQKLNELSFVPNVQNQAVFMEVVSPNQRNVEFPITKRITDVFDFLKTGFILSFKQMTVTFSKVCNSPKLINKDVHTFSRTCSKTPRRCWH